MVEGDRPRGRPTKRWSNIGTQCFQIIHIHTTVINSGRAHTTQHRTHCGLRLRLQSWLMPRSPHSLRNDLKCVEWDVKPCSIQSNPMIRWISASVQCQRLFNWHRTRRSDEESDEPRFLIITSSSIKYLSSPRLLVVVPACRYVHRLTIVVIVIIMSTYPSTIRWLPRYSRNP